MAQTVSTYVEEAVAGGLRHELLSWYAGAARTLPWRETQDPYAIFLSEIILQQTRVAQGLPYYERFIETYPTVEALAAAADDDVMRLWQGLGYYSRARNLVAAARRIAAEGWPQTADGLAQLPGIGPYTAAAVASFAFGESVPVLDGNVARVISRWFDLPDDISRPTTQSAMRGLAGQVMGYAPPGAFNQAIMEFGALQCVPKQPPCLVCPVRGLCMAFERSTVPVRPVKSKAKAKRERHLLYLALRDEDGRLLVHRREGRGIWQGLYEFFCVETAGAAPTLTEGLQSLANLLELDVQQLSPGHNLYAGSHMLSHQILQIEVREVSLAATLSAPEGYRWVSPVEWEALGKPVPIVKSTAAMNELTTN